MDRNKTIIAVTIVIIVIIGVIIFNSVNASQKDYDTVVSVEYNYYKVNNKGKFGVLNKKGELIVPANYDDIVIPNPSKAVFICQYNYNSTTGEADNIILNDKNNQILDRYELVEAIPVTGMIGSIPYEKLVLRYKQDGLYGLLSIDGNKITDAIYDEIASVPYKEGVMLTKKDGKYGVITNKGVLLINNEYDNIIGDGYYNNEVGYKSSGFIVTKGEYTGYISDNGENILEVEYDSVYRIKELPDRYLIVKRNGQYGLLDNTKIIIGFNYQSLEYDENANLIIVKRNKNYGVINIEGNKVLPLEFSDIVIEGMYIICEKNNVTEKYWLDGTKVKDDTYSRIQKTNGEYYISIDQNYNYGILDKNMNVVIPNKYEYLDYASDELIIVRNSSGKYGIINLNEQTKANFTYDVMHTVKGTKIVQALMLDTNVLNLYDFNAQKIYDDKNANMYEYDDYVMVLNGTNVTYFSNTGIELTNADIYPNNKLLAYKDNGKWGFKNRSGETVVKAEYDKVTELNQNGFAGIYSNGKWGIINSEGTMIAEPTYEIDSSNSTPDFLGKNYSKSYNLYTALE